jgi:galactokinase
VPTYRAPGRANLIGEHTDHTDGLVLPAAIDRAVTLEVELGGPRIVLGSADAEGRVDVPADGSEAPPTGWGRYVAAVAAELDALGREPVGCTGALWSDLPQGAGLSSSAALEVVVAVALTDAGGMELDALELAAACRRAEHRAVGVPSGIMDQAASLLGREGRALFLDCGTLEYRHVAIPGDLALLMIDSGVSRRLESSGYAQRIEELRAALSVLGGRRPAEVDPAELGGLVTGLEDVSARRLRHVVTENARVLQTEAALTARDLAGLGEIFAAGHASLRDDFEVSIPELDLLVDLAGEAGAVAARLTGGGFGGAIIALAPRDQADVIGERVLEGYARRYPDRAAAAHVCQAADGAGRIHA